MEVKIAIVDADLIGRKNHRFPNLVCMKLSGYYKEMGAVTLKTDYKGLDKYDKVFIAKVFTDTVVPNDVLCRQNVTYGGTGFFMTKQNHCQMKLNITCLIIIYMMTLEKHSLNRAYQRII